ncbi:MAG: hypothetical protein B7Z35_13115 [Hydrogenophilales bacterium 12-61-10]|nr:MAG: hypothetical protein B7Z35_13115 [Hydrogenophilales bacterium 12-61-10]OYX25768.1 MAG: hypothetical protein B7Z03_15305 [Hydrogenophilales bacterium 32-62-9]
MFRLHWGGDWRHDFTRIALGGGNLFILLLGLKLQSQTGWQISFALVGLTSFWAWHANLKRYRTVADTPTSRIASAPQGYVEVVGRGQQPLGTSLVSPISGLPCLWYRYQIEEKIDNRWEHVQSDVSHDTFGVNDGTGQLLVDPDGAQIITSRKQVSTLGNLRKTEWTLIEGETIYVIGEHVTLGGANAVLSKSADLSALLAEWKADKTRLLARFDANRDGEISLEEWEHARHEASIEVDRAHLETRLKDGIHLIRQPRHSRPFIVANRKIDALTRHFRLWSWFHMALMLGALLGFGFAQRIA